MDAIFQKMIDLSINASWLILAVIAARFLLRKVPAAWRGLLWVLVGVKLLCPVSVESHLSLVPDTTVVREQMQIQIVELPETEQIIGDLEYTPQMQQKPIVEKADTEPVQKTVKVMDVLPYVWLTGIIVMLVHALISYRKIQRRARVSLHYENHVWICDDINTPFILGILRPRIYLPSTMDKETMTHVLAHENAHLKRKDHWWKPLGYLVLSVYWINPFVWAAYILMCRDIELACDEKVIVKLDAEQKKAYSNALLNCSIPRKMIAACPVAFGEVGVKMRIRSIFNYKKPAFWVIVVALLAVIGVGVFFGTKPKDTVDTVEFTDYTSYFDQDQDNVFADLEEKNIVIEQSESIGADYVQESWIATEDLEGCEHLGYLQFGNRNDELQVAEVVDVFQVDLDENGQDPKYIRPIYDWLVEKYGEPAEYTIYDSVDPMVTIGQKMADVKSDDVLKENWAYITWYMEEQALQLSRQVGEDQVGYQITSRFSENISEYENVISKDPDEENDEENEVSMEQVFVPEYIELVGHNFMQYLDQDMETIRNSLDDAGLTIEDRSIPEIDNARTWVIIEDIQGWERETQLNFGIFGDRSDMRMTQLIQRYSYPEAFTDDDRQMISDIYDEIFAAYGIPDSLGEYQYDNDEYYRDHFNDVLYHSDRVITFQTTWGASKETVTPLMRMSTSVQMNQKGGQIFVNAGSPDAIAFTTENVNNQNNTVSEDADMGHDFSQYLDQSMESVLLDLAANGLEVQSQRITPGGRYATVDVNETVNDWKTGVTLEFAIYGDSDVLRLCYYSKRCELPDQDTMSDEDWDSIISIYDEFVAKHGEPGCIDQYYFKEAQDAVKLVEYDREYFIETLGTRRVVNFEVAWWDLTRARSNLYRGYTDYIDGVWKSYVFFNECSWEMEELVHSLYGDDMMTPEEIEEFNELIVNGDNIRR